MVVKRHAAQLAAAAAEEEGETAAEPAASGNQPPQPAAAEAAAAEHAEAAPRAARAASGARQAASQVGEASPEAARRLHPECRPRDLSATEAGRERDRTALAVQALRARQAKAREQISALETSEAMRQAEGEMERLRLARGAERQRLRAALEEAADTRSRLQTLRFESVKCEAELDGAVEAATAARTAHLEIELAAATAELRAAREEAAAARREAAAARAAAAAAMHSAARGAEVL